MILCYARKRRRRIIEEILLGGADTAERKISQKDGGMEILNRFLVQGSDDDAHLEVR